MKPKLKKRCEDCEKAPAVIVSYVKWYKDQGWGTHTLKYASLCADCSLTSRSAGDMLPEPKNS